MADIQLDQYGDIQITNNALTLTSEGVESVEQRLEIRLKLFFREWILDRSAGTKWFEKVLIKDPDKGIADQEIRTVVLNTQGVKSIEKWESTIDRSKRDYEVSFIVKTTDEEIVTFSFSDILNE